MKTDISIKVLWIAYGLFSELFERRKRHINEEGEIYRITVGSSHISVYGGSHYVYWGVSDSTFEEGCDGRYFVYGDDNWPDSEILAGCILSIMNSNNVRTIDGINIETFYQHE